MATITATGHLAAAPEMHYATDGSPRVNFRMAETSRRKNPQTGEYEDTGTLWLSCVIFGARAEPFAESVGKGTLVTVTGRMSVREYVTEQGEQRSSNDVVCDVAGLVPKPQPRVDSAPF